MYTQKTRLLIIFYKLKVIHKNLRMRTRARVYTYIYMRFFESVVIIDMIKYYLNHYMELLLFNERFKNNSLRSISINPLSRYSDSKILILVLCILYKFTSLNTNGTINIKQRTSLFLCFARKG